MKRQRANKEKYEMEDVVHDSRYEKCDVGEIARSQQIAEF